MKAQLSFALLATLLSASTTLAVPTLKGNLTVN